MCRQFKLPPPSSEATARLTTACNQVVQHDLLFADSHALQSSLDLPANKAAIPPFPSAYNGYMQ
eukprot:11566441-Prorocentrum_lima.AAC.1